MPLALGTVVQESLKGRDWVEGKVFRTSVESVLPKPGWRLPGVGEVLGWGFRLLIGGGGGGKENELLEKGKAQWKVVILSNLEIAASEVTRRMAQPGRSGRAEKIFSRAAFREEFGDVLQAEKKLSDEDLGLLLKYLSRDKQVLVTDGATIRFLDAGEKEGEKGISEEDTTIASLKALISDLEAQTTSLSAKIDTLSTSAKEAVARKNRLQALSFLRSKKLAETTLAKRHATLGQLEEVFTSIEQANDQVELVRVMQDSTKVLKGLNKQVGGVERVDEVVEGLREEMEKVNEIGGVISEVGQMGAVDEGEVDGELEEMERVEREKVEAAEAKAREEREKKEAEETKRKLDELEKVEREAREEKERKDKEAEKTLDDSTELLRRMALEPNADGTAVL